MSKNKKLLTYLMAVLMGLGMLLWMVPPSIFSFHNQSPTTTSTLIATTTATTISYLNKNKNMLSTTKNPNQVLMVVAFKGFRDEEYLQPKKVLEQAGYSINTTSNKTGIAEGTYGTTVVVNTDIHKINPDDYKIVVFVGGEGMGKELDNPSFHNLAKEFVSANKPIAAICLAPAMLAKAGILRGKKATVWSSSLNQEPVRILKANGAIYEKGPIVKDGDIITANGPTVATQFGEELVKFLNERQ